MEINALSRDLYSDVPKGGFVFMIDKIGLRINSNYLRKENLGPWKTNNFITILTYGYTAQINIHAEFEPKTKHLGRKCLNAVLILINAGVFKSSFSIQFMAVLNCLFPFIYFFDFLAVFMLKKYFELVEWEWAFDFLDYSPYANIETDNINPKSLLKHKNSYYSKDSKCYRRLRKNKDGKNVLLSKGKQKSFLIGGYERSSKIKSERPIYRTELRQQGRYKNDLSMNLLEGTHDDAFEKAMPSLKRTLNKVVDINLLELSDYWKRNIPQQYASLFMEETDKK